MKVSIVMGSDSDLPVMKEAADILKSFGIETAINVASAHRTPEKVIKLISDAEKAGTEVFIAGAGMAAHLAGVVAAHTTRPVIGVPMTGGALNGVDALYSTVQMPKGVPVATVAIGKAGAINAGVLAAQILSVKDEGLREKLAEYRNKQAQAIEEIDAKLQQDGVDKFLDNKK